MKTIETLIDDIYQMIDEGSSSVSYADMIEFQEDIANAVIGMLNREKDHRGAIRLSQMGQPCARKQWYSHRGVEGEPLLPHTRLKFIMGHIIEALIILLAKTAGHEVTDQQKCVEVSGVKGSMDCKIDGVLVDVKSASSYSFKKFQDGGLFNNDPFGYVTQISAYLEAEGEDSGAFLAMDKQLGKLALLPVMRKLGIAEEVEGRKQQVLSEETPERAFLPVPDGVSGNMKLGTNCSYCDYKKECYPEVRTFIYANGPRYLTTVVKQPNVPEATSE